MAKKSRSSGKKHYQGYNYKRPKRPLWMRIIRLIALIICTAVLILAIIGMIDHWIAHLKGYVK